jgi:hypothetical protein
MKMFHLRIYCNLLRLIFLVSVIGIIALFMSGCKKKSEPTPNPSPLKYNLSVSANDKGSAIYIDGLYSGHVTPYEFYLAEGDHVIGVGLKSTEQYLRKKITVTPIKKLKLILGQDDLQKPRLWKALFVGIYHACDAGHNVILSYSKEDLDLAYAYFKYSFQHYVEPYSYHTMLWQFQRKDIVDDTVVLNIKNLLSLSILEKYIAQWGIKKGQYDLIVSFYRFQGDNDNTASDDLGTFNGMAWYNKTDISVRSSYYMIRYYRNVKKWLDEMKTSDPGMFVHEWLHTVCETFYPGFGVAVPDPTKGGGSSLHAIEAYGYRFPWMTGYRDLMRGQIKEISYTNKLNPKQVPYVGITPDDFLKCTVCDAALGQCQ